MGLVQSDDRVHRTRRVIYGVQGHQFPAHLTGLTWGVFSIALLVWTLIVLLVAQPGLYRGLIWGATLASVTTAWVRWQVNGDMTLTGFFQHQRHEVATYWAARRANVTRDRAARPTTTAVRHVKINDREH